MWETHSNFIKIIYILSIFLHICRFVRIWVLFKWTPGENRCIVSVHWNQGQEENPACCLVGVTCLRSICGQISDLFNLHKICWKCISLYSKYESHPVTLITLHQDVYSYFSPVPGWRQKWLVLSHQQGLIWQAVSTLTEKKKITANF